MRDLIVVFIVSCIAIAWSEMLVRGLKLQTCTSRFLASFGTLGSVAALYLFAMYGGGVVSFTLYWIGLFVCWFGVRSHVESSILLRMIYALTTKHLTTAELLDGYRNYYGVEDRLSELKHGGLVDSNQGSLTVTPKGRLVLNVVKWLA
jgi:hypothetical protein